MKVILARPEHEVAYQDLVALISKHASKLTALEILAVAANMVGKLIALQDQRAVTREMVLQILTANIEHANADIIKQLKLNIEGHG